MLVKVNFTIMLNFTSRRRKYVITNLIFLTIIRFWHLQRFLVDKKLPNDTHSPYLW